MNKLLKDAIADAKAVRETALANAKMALEEAFAPKIQSMLSHKIKEEMEMEDEYSMSDEEETEEPTTEGSTFDMYEGDDEVVAAEEEEVADEEVADEEVADEESEEISDEELDEILRELEGDEDDEEEQVENYHEDDEEAPTTEARKKNKMMEEEGDEEASMEDEEEVDLEKIIRALREEDHAEEEPEAKSEEELEEAYRVIRYLRTKLNEINLLNAKLLYVNKLFKKADLSESKKIKIVETFDRVRSVREAKLVYATLSESIAPAKSNPVIRAKKAKTSLKEGFASSASKGTKVIHGGNEVINRFKELVNYNKNN